jgi:hypothetical protein
MTFRHLHPEPPSQGRCYRWIFDLQDNIQAPAPDGKPKALKTKRKSILNLFWIVQWTKGIGKTVLIFAVLLTNTYKNEKGIWHYRK